MAERSFEEIAADRAALNSEENVKTLAGTKEIIAILGNGKVASLEDDLRVAMTKVAPGSIGYQQANYIVSVLTNARPSLANDVKRMEDGALI